MNHFVEKIDLKNSLQVEKVRLFLNKFHLKLSNDIDLTFVIQNTDQEIVATCSKANNILKGFAIDDNYRGEGLTNILITAMQNQLFKENIFHSFIYTKPHYGCIFQSLGYNIISSVKGVVLLESGFNSINKSIEKIKEKYDINPSTPKTALVMNCNPFTLGHRFIIEKASRESKEVLVFIVEENKSVFPFLDRYNLVKSGVSDLKNVTVIPGGEYIISQATFPNYFIKEHRMINNAYSELDATIFADYFCKKLNITKRIVGEEPYCEVTRDYNNSLKKILCKKGVEVEVIPRLVTQNNKNKNNNFISASKVRKSIKLNKPSLTLHSNLELELLLPEITINYLHSKEGKEIIEKILQS